MRQGFASQPKDARQMIDAARVSVSSITFWERNPVVEPERFGPDSYALYQLSEDLHEPPSGEPFTTTAELEHVLQTSGMPSAGLAPLLSVALNEPERCAPGPCVALGWSPVDEHGKRHVPAVLYQDGIPYLYMTWAEPEDTWNKSFKFVVARAVK